MKRIDEQARCLDCDWADVARGCRGRAAQHHLRTGHEVVTEKTVVYERAPDPDQLTFAEAAA